MEMQCQRWFQANSARLFAFERDQETMFTDLTIELRRVHKNLTFELPQREPVEGRRAEGHPRAPSTFAVSRPGSAPYSTVDRRTLERRTEQGYCTRVLCQVL